MNAALTMAMLASDSESLIGLYHSGFIICLAFAILFFIVSVVLFFVFHIKEIFDMKTGRAQKKKIDEMEKENALTGRLITPKNKKPGAEQSAFSGKLNKIRNDLNNKRMQSQGPDDFSARQHYENQQFPEQAYKPQPLVAPPPASPYGTSGADADGAEGTSVLGTPVADDYGNEGTSVLGTPVADDYGTEGTSVLGTPGGEPYTDPYGAEGTSVLGTPGSEPYTDPYGAEGTSVLGTPGGEPYTDPYGAEGTSVLGTPGSEPYTDPYGAEGTSVLGTPGSEPYTDPYGAEGTSVLGAPGSEPYTDPYGAEGTSVLSPADPAAPANFVQPVHNVAEYGELGVAAESIDFSVGGAETGKLDEININKEQASHTKFEIVKDVLLIHTQETIN